MPKLCKPCRRELDESMFNKRIASPDGLCVICRECSAEKNRAWREKNPDGFRKWKEANSDKRASYMAQWDSKNRARKSENYRRWVDRNRAFVYARNAERQAAKLRAIPPWADMGRIAAFYKEAVRITKDTGVRHEVDHIFPLRGKMACGLHCEQNLQILTRSENARKKNHMPMGHE